MRQAAESESNCAGHLPVLGARIFRVVGGESTVRVPTYEGLNL
jgi:hypothetical protein